MLSSQIASDLRLVVNFKPSLSELASCKDLPRNNIHSSDPLVYKKGIDTRKKLVNLLIDFIKEIEKSFDEAGINI